MKGRVTSEKSPQILNMRRFRMKKTSISRMRDTCANEQGSASSESLASGP